VENQNLLNQHPFKRGAMTFEDYNYSLFNPFILVENGIKEKRHQDGKSNFLDEDKLKNLQ